MRKITLKHSLPARLARHFDEDLNESQRTAVTAPEGYNLILAGPGSGKTRVITYRVAYLIARGVPAESILLVTFTRRAAREMVRRLESLIGQDAGKVWAGTFHHAGNRLLRRPSTLLGYQPNFTILDSEDQLDLIRLAMDDAGFAAKDKLAPKPAEVEHLISFSLNTRVPLAQVIAIQSPGLVEWLPKIEAVAQAYQRRKLTANCMDYDDLLTQWLRLLSEFPDQLDHQAGQFRHVLIDEMQDTNALQVEIVETIVAAGSGNLTAVGDDAQSIYRFRGANYDNILKFPERHPDARRFLLEINYRSSPEIVKLTNASIAHNRLGFAKSLVSALTAGALPVVQPLDDAYAEAEYVCDKVLEIHEEGTELNRMAVLYRNHHDSILIQNVLVQRGITYEVRSGLRFFEQAHIKDVLAYLRIVVNPQDEAAWRRLLLLLPGIGPAKATVVVAHLLAAAEPLATLADASTMALVPAKSKGPFAAFVADLQKIVASNPEADPASALRAILEGGYPATLRGKYEQPELRLADIEQMGVLAAGHDSLERMIAELLLAGDVYGAGSLEGSDPADVLVLSTIHQAKGLEWSCVFVPRLIDEGFPNYRALSEPGGEDEERRIFYVAVTRAMNELFLTYPIVNARGAWAPSTLTKPSRFLKELDRSLYETPPRQADSRPGRP
jgi:DNA helicase II / ATP-dependent DNA helicase PcrA